MPRIDPYLFERQFAAFEAFVEGESGAPLVSFASNQYTEDQEGYKYKIHGEARKSLSFSKWTRASIGKGAIITATISAIEIPHNNLVGQQNRYGKDSRPQKPLYEALEDTEARKAVETCLYQLYHEPKEAQSFAELLRLLGRKYPLPAYLCFVKDRSRFLPIAPTYFDRAFALLGADFKTSRRCSWENYSAYIGLIGELKSMLAEALSGEVTLLDAHSFAWILSAQMADKGEVADVSEYSKLSTTEREAIIRARVGQGQFRQRLIEYWQGCAVTGCSETALLRASHIKPWSESTLKERLHLFNGLLLSPALDACFDSGFVSFDDNGNILISMTLGEDDLASLGIRHDMRLTTIEPYHRKYLDYHRTNIFDKRT